MASSRKKGRKRLVAFRAGVRGRSQVRVVKRRGTYWLDWREGATRKWENLHHLDLEAAQEEAVKRAATLTGPSTRGTLLPLHALFDKYLKDATPMKGRRTQQHDRRALATMRAVFADNPMPHQLTKAQIDRFVSVRRAAGDQRTGKDGRPLGRPISNRIIRYDLLLLNAVLNWGVQHKPRLVQDNPIKRAWLPMEEQPNRVMITDEEYAALLAAHEVPGAPPMRKVYLVLAHELGGRRAALAALRWSDIDLAAGVVIFPKETSKTGYGFRVMLSDVARSTLETWRREQARDCLSPWVFPAPSDPTRPMSVDRARDWFKRLEKRAGLPPREGRGWHSFRRKLVTDCASDPDLTPKDLQDMGGWKDYRMVMTYMQGNPEAQRTALNRRSAKQQAG